MARPGSIVRRALPIYVALVLAGVTLGLLYTLVLLRHVLLIVFVSMLFASALTGPADWLARRLHLPRAVSAVGIYLALFGVVTGIGWLVIPPLFGQVAEFADKAPGYVERYDDLRRAYEGLRRDFPALPKFEDQAGRIGGSLVGWAGDQVTGLPTMLFARFLDVLSVFVISILLLTSRERIRDFALSLARPADRPALQALLDDIWTRIGAYLRAKVIVMLIVGAVTYGALLAIGVSFAVPLAIIVALGEIVPRAGPWLARLPLFAVAGLQGWKVLVLTIVASVVIENAKGYVISPFVEGDQLDIHPLLVFVSVLVGAALGGAAGAFVAVPLAAVVDLVVKEVVVPWRRRQIAEGPPDLITTSR